MATNQVIHGSNRVVENPNRYKLNAVSGQANTYDLEKVPGVITDIGTPYSKTVLDKIDNVLSYLTPSVEKVISGTSDVVVTGTFMPTTWTQVTQWTKYSSDYTLQDGTTGKVYISTNDAPSQSTSTYIVNAFNGVTNNYAYINNNGSFIVEFDKPIKITKIEMIQNSSSQAYWDIYGSNNGVDYIMVGSGQRIGSQNITFNTNADYYKFYKFKSELATGNYSALNITIKEYNYSITTYKNQFTLDNNGNNFVNNQRVLIETDKNVEEVETTLTQNIFPTDISPFWDYGETRHSLDTNLISGKLTQFNNVEPTYEWITTSQSGFYTHAATNTYAGFTTINTQNTQGFGLSSGAFTLNEQRTTSDSQNQNVFACYGNEETSIYKIYDMKIECKPTFSYYFSSIEGMSKKCIEASNDNINWVELTSLNTTQSTFAPQDYYRYYRFRFDNNSYGSFEMRYCYISQVIYKETKEIPYDVVSNIINEVPCDTLLQPGTKYELIYNGSTNKFELGGIGKIIFDTTLSSDVNSIDTNINLLDNKLYKLIIKGSLTTSGSLDCYNENQNIIAECYVTTSTANPFCSEFTICDNTTSIIEKGSSTVSMLSSYFTGSSTIKTIKVNTSSKNITSGTRIIILEVA